MKYVSFTLVGLITSLAISSLIYVAPRTADKTGVENESTTQILGVREETEVSEDHEKEIAYWQKIVAQNPSYYDGWLHLLYLGHETGNVQLQKVSWQELQKNSLFNEAQIPENVRPTEESGQ
ncbi:hypothetical protein C4579_04205 [Candidatus Microgenomates bacterium]|nr:MAG: hypothetical protein C4579_04205 [Candidatus Microgenomates bacterium]